MRSLLLIVLLVSWASPPSASAQGCPHDDALARVAARLSLEAARPGPEAIFSALRQEDSDRISAHMLWLDAPSPERRQAWLAGVRARAEAGLVCGESQSADHIVIVAAERAGQLDRSPNAPQKLVAHLAAGFGDAYLVFRGADGELLRRRLSEADFSHGFASPPELESPVTVQLVASGPGGPRPVAERSFSVEAEDEGLTEVGLSIPAGASVASVVAALRESRDVAPLRPNRLLASVAHRYAERVCQAGRVVHRLDESGDPRARLLHAGIAARVVGEAAARASTVPEALTSLAASPSHLMAIVDRRFTDGGYGVAADSRGRRCVVVLLAAWPRAVPATR